METGLPVVTLFRSCKDQIEALKVEFGMDLASTPDVPATASRFERFVIVMTCAIDELKDILLRWAQAPTKEAMAPQIEAVMGKLKANGFV